MTTCHVPVQLVDVLNALEKSWGTNWAGKRMIDGTFGGGGYTEEFLNRGATMGVFDFDETALQRRDDLAKTYGDRFIRHHASFADLANYVTQPQDAIVLDLGISSDQLDDPERGLSYQANGPLDMRLNQDITLTAGDILNKASEEELTRIFRSYGEEPRAKPLARLICQQRLETDFTTTQQLMATIETLYPYKQKRGHPANRIFQALRIAVNGELDALEAFLPQARDLLASGGILAIVTFHSLEDRLVKQFMRAQCHAQQDIFGRHVSEAAFSTRKVKVSDAEATENPRARSAILRLLTKHA